ncbi:MAG TPA: ABC transporter ATP-binding protein [Candidatus Scybalocola faecavium]|nr:ABC transporter ATP-binding protein [Candidatus Scybalocola faecavium]
MIEIKNLTKIYKLNKKQQKEQKTKSTQKKAVDDLSLTVQPGEIFGLLGTNGAGKTTTLRCLATLLKPTRGTITVDGLDVCHDAEKVRAKISFLTNEIKMDPYFTPDYLFSFFGRLRGMKEEEINARKKELFEYFGIMDFKDKKVEELSTGMKQKVSIAVSLVHDPEIIIFDEPTNGLDIITARAVLDYLRMLKERGKTIIVSTHVMSEAQKLCDRIAIIIDGKLAAMGTLEELEAQTGSGDLEDAFFEFYRQYEKEA